ncbi:uncharacterized protein LOC132202359 [Neocloeon triangulifer]|uniref:uncharacterized protein LOC132202359 n=1 Tax=Neocloeon triangulifer TaxID=2078957 RepID=UPI00286F2A94|nr:uncharacterized protein LOC132202359 [Neocloeon triangulifer]
MEEKQSPISADFARRVGDLHKPQPLDDNLVDQREQGVPFSGEENMNEPKAFYLERHKEQWFTITYSNTEEWRTPFIESEKLKYIVYMYFYTEVNSRVEANKVNNAESIRPFDQALPLSKDNSEISSAAAMTRKTDDASREFEFNLQKKLLQKVQKN